MNFSNEKGKSEGKQLETLIHQAVKKIGAKKKMTFVVIFLLQLEAISIILQCAK